MEEKKPFSTKLEAFFAGKGFYIVLFLCVAVIGVSAWSMLAGSGLDVEAPGDMAVSVADIGEDVITTSKMQTAVVTEAPAAPAAPPEEDSTPAEPASVTASVPAEEMPVMAEVRDYYIWPVSGAVENAYSMTALIFDRTMQDWRTHDGLDIAAAIGTQVKAAANGKVAEVFDDDLYGTTVVISHSGGLCSTYSNLAATPTVSVGEQVGVGQVIGAVGDTALCESGEVSHLHFSMTLDGESVDPAEYMP